MSRLSRTHKRKGMDASALVFQPSNTSSEDVNMSLQQLEEAIQVIPNNEKAAYLEAMERCPWLVACEPGPMRFIRYYKFNIWEAARRFIKFWEVRKEVFGDDRAFLPMHQTGNGALSDYDLELFSTGFFSILPNDSGDGNHCQIVPCLIPSRIVRDNEDLKNFMKCSFYFHSVVMENTNDDKPCYTCILACNWKGFKRLQGLEPAATMLSHFPMYGENPFFVQIPDDVEKMTYFQMIVPPILKLVNMINRAGNRTHVIGGSSFQDIANQLADHGFRRESLPPECGGSWTIDKFRQWQKERVELERQRENHYITFASARMMKNPRCTATMPEPLDENGTSEAEQLWAFESTATDAGSMGLAAAYKKNPPAVAAVMKEGPEKIPQGTPANATAVDRRRIMDRIHSKNKRIKRKQKFEVLQASVEEVTAQNKRLKSENIRLEEIVKKAHEVVLAQLSSGAIQQDHHHQHRHPVHTFAVAAHIPQQHQTTHPVHPSIPAAPLPQLHQTYLPALNPVTGSLFQQQYPLNPTVAQQQLPLLQPQWLDGALMDSSAINFLQMPNQLHQLTLPNQHTTEALQPRFGGHGTATVLPSPPSWWNLFTRTTTNASTLQTQTPTDDLFTERPRRQEEEQQQQHQYEERKPPPSW